MNNYAYGKTMENRQRRVDI